MKSPRKELLFVWVSLSIRVYAKAPVVARVWYCLCAWGSLCGYGAIDATDAAPGAAAVVPRASGGP